MFCRNCATQLVDQAVACTSCGHDPRAGARFCWSCGSETASGAVMCVKCGVSLVRAHAGAMRKSRLAAGLLNLLLPLFLIGGIGRLYMGYTGLGIAQLVTSLLCVGIPWSMIDGILILAGRPETDSEGQPLDS